MTTTKQTKEVPMKQQTYEKGPVSNDAANGIVAPYRVECAIEGTTDILFHRWSVEALAQQREAAKGARGKKTDDVDSYVYRNADGMLCVPGEYFRQSVIHAARYRQDPRSPRKSAMDLYRAGLIAETDLCSLGVKTWDRIDQRRCVVQRNGITRNRPAMATGWRAVVVFSILLPEYIDQATLRDVVVNAGRLVGVGDFRPTYGRFAVTSWKVLA
jgi:hypothetical protein